MVPSHGEGLRIPLGPSVGRAGPCFRSGELTGGVVSGTSETVTPRALAETSLRVCSEGDLLIAMYGVGTLGKTAIAGVTLTMNQAVGACTPVDGVQVRFLQLVMESLRPECERLAAGSAQRNISRKKLVAQEGCIPSTAEQNRIVARVDELTALCASIEAAFAGERTLAGEFADSAIASLLVQPE
jgi:type I restriction enzyme S subunit